MRYWKRLKEKKFIRFLCVMYKKIRYDRIDVYAAQAGFYLIMSAAPIIMLLFTLLKFTPLTQDVVMDGRDIGTSVLPDAPLKDLSDGNVATRARRRFLELEEKGQAADLNEIEEDIRRRDEQDMTRKLSPLRQAEDALLIDTTGNTLAESIDLLGKLSGTVWGWNRGAAV